MVQSLLDAQAARLASAALAYQSVHLLPMSQTADMSWGDCAGKVGIWESSSVRCRHVLEGPDGAVEWLHWHPRGDLILAGSEDFTAWLWNAQTGAFMTACTSPLPAPQELCVFTQHTAWLRLQPGLVMERLLTETCGAVA